MDRCLGCFFWKTGVWTARVSIAGASSSSACFMFIGASMQKILALAKGVTLLAGLFLWPATAPAANLEAGLAISDPDILERLEKKGLALDALLKSGWQRGATVTPASNAGLASISQMRDVFRVVDALTYDEVQALGLREIVQFPYTSAEPADWGAKTTTPWFEVLGPPTLPLVPDIGDTRQPCPSCGREQFSSFSTKRHPGMHHFTDAALLPAPLPSLFVAGGGRDGTRIVATRRHARDTWHDELSPRRSGAATMSNDARSDDVPIAAQIGVWLSHVCRGEVPPDDIRAFNVGLFQAESGFTAYLIGSRSYDADDDDWACNVDFEPQQKYCLLVGANSEAWDIVLRMVIDAVREFVASDAGRDCFLARAEAVCVGFDDGELTRIT